MAAIIENSGDIARSSEDVFDYLSDIGNEVRWNPDCVSMERLTDGSVGVGARYRAKWKQSPYVVSECTEYDRPRTWAWKNGGPMSVQMRFTLEPLSPGRTKMTVRGEWTPHGWFRLVFPLFVRIMRRAEVQTFANAKRALEEGRDRVPGVASSVIASSVSERAPTK
jgi:hypothetical protein